MATKTLTEDDLKQRNPLLRGDGNEGQIRFTDFQLPEIAWHIDLEQPLFLRAITEIALFNPDFR